MRNLKRALSLALASVMLIGMMVVGSSAKGLDDFSDAAEITNTDAVAVTSEIGIFKGYNDGEFKADNVVTRAEMAVIVAKMLYGADVKVDQFAEIDTFTDVPAWAEGYVNLAASLGIVAGRGNGIFDPNATVTTAEAAMMLTKTLGYFQNSKDFGNNWKLAATAKATELNLYGDLKLSADAGLTRENVAVLVFNALTKAVPVQYNELLGVYYNENQGIIYSLEFNYLQTLGYKNFDLVYKSNTETMYGRPATTWGFGSYNVNTSASTTTKTDLLTEDGGLIASKVRMLSTDEIITIANVPTYVYTEGTKEKDVYKDLGATVCNEKVYDWTAFVNGTEVSEKTYAPVKNSTDIYAYTDEGTVTEIYIDDADETVTVVEINYYLGEVTKVKADEDGEYITVKATSDGAKLDEKTFYVEGYAEDDLVIFTIDENDDGKAVIGEVFEPVVVTGTVSRVDQDKNTGSTYLRIDGTKYIYSQGDDADQAQQDHMVYDLDAPCTLAHPTLNEEYNLYLDPNGYVIAFNEAEETVYNYLYVLDSDEELGDWQAKVLLTDGSVANVDVKEAEGVAAHENDTDNDGIYWIEDNAQHTNNSTNLDRHIWKYTVNSKGVYTLTYVDDVTGSNDWTEGQKSVTGAEINNGKAYITAGVNELIVDKKTTFVDYDNETAYVGYKNVPNVEAAKIAYVQDEKIGVVVFILDGEIYDNNATYFILASQERESLKYDGKHYWAYSDAYVDGEKTTVIVAYNYDGVAGDDAALTVGIPYKALKSIDDKYITLVEDVRYDAVASGRVTTVGDETFWMAVGNAYTEDKSVKFDTNDDTVFVVVEKDSAGDIESISAGNLKDMNLDPAEYSVWVYVLKASNDKETADLVYIMTKEIPQTTSGTTTPGTSTVTWVMQVVAKDTGVIITEKTVETTATNGVYGTGEQYNYDQSFATIANSVFGVNASAYKVLQDNPVITVDGATTVVYKVAAI